MIREIRWHILNVLLLIDQSAVYYSIQLGRCVLLSFGVLALVKLLRSTVFRRTVFVKGMAWGVFVAAPFLGKLRMFYDNLWMCRLFMWWNDLCMLYWPVRYGYVLGMAASACVMVRRRRKLRALMDHMEKREIFGQEIYVSEMTAAPFTSGIIHAGIVFPKQVLDCFREADLETILLHEKTHIRLGHLWFYLMWDVIRTLLWPNALLTVCMKDFKDDMEDICDKVTIQISGRTAYEYGALILKCMQIFQTGNPPSGVCFAGQNGYRRVRKRFLRITGHKAYGRWMGKSLCLCGLAALIGIFLAIGQVSYPRYAYDHDMVLSNEEGEKWILHDSENLRNALSADGKTVSIERRAMDRVLHEYGIEETDFWILFGGYEKLPGLGGGGSLVHVDYSGQEEKIEFPYQDSDACLTTILYKLM